MSDAIDALIFVNYLIMPKNRICNSSNNMHI